MQKKIKFIELNYYYHPEFKTPAEVIAKHKPSNLFAEDFAAYADVVLVKHCNYKGEHEEKGIRYLFFKRKNNFWKVPFSTHRFIKKEDPVIILVQGFLFPLQVFFLKMKVSRKCKIILQHQADVPFKKKKIFQKIADRYIDGYLFASIDLAEEWIKAGIIRDKKKCFELPASSSVFLHKNKQEARNELNIAEGNIFLWVGRLNKNKDPLTVLKAFEKFFLVNTEAQLYMIYHEDDLLADIKKKINENYQIKERVHLVGKVQHTEMATWYSAADFYISGSRREGGSFALTEAMACGCIPIVTEIPASLTAIQNGAYGLHYHPGNVNELFKKLLEAIAISKEEFSDKIQKYFKEELSAKAVANRLNNIIQNLLTE